MNLGTLLTVWAAIHVFCAAVVYWSAVRGGARATESDWDIGLDAGPRSEAETSHPTAEPG